MVYHRYASIGDSLFLFIYSIYTSHFKFVKLIFLNIYIIYLLYLFLTLIILIPHSGNNYFIYFFAS